jgi:uncharacterized protein YdhG (YjbR/CyaY superfamily)
MHKEIGSYLTNVPRQRRKRLETIRKAFLHSEPDVKESMRYKMPTFEKGQNWAAVANQKNYISVYFCSDEIIENIKRKHPGLSTGKVCVRIKDNQDIPINDLVVSFRKAMKFKKAT